MNRLDLRADYILACEQRRKERLQKLKPFYGPPRGFSYLKEVQPIFDEKCISCHDGEKQMSLKSTPRKMSQEKRLWAESYLNLIQAEKKWGKAMHGKVDGKFLMEVARQ